MVERKKKYYLSAKVKYKCNLCGAISYDSAKATRHSLRDRELVAVMMSSHVLFGGVDLEKAKRYLETCINNSRRTCRIHFGDAAKYLAMELVASRVPFSSHGDGSARYGMTAIVDRNDIPRKLLNRLDEVVKQLDKDLSITAEDVGKFINTFLWRYLCRNHTNTGWDAITELLPGIRRKKVVKSRRGRPPKNMVNPSTLPPPSVQPSTSEIPREELPSKHAIDDMLVGIRTDHEYAYKNLIYHAYHPEHVPLCSSSTKVEPDSSSGNRMPISAFDLIRPLPRLARTDPELLRRTVCVDVEALLDLFQLCPQCGQKLELDGSVQFMLHGAEPVVQYICERCSQEGAIIKTWKAWKSCKNYK